METSMVMKRLIGGWLTLVVLATGVWAQTPEPTPESTTAPSAQAPATAAPQASVPVDSTTPRGALKLLSVAIDRGDTAAVRTLMHTTSVAERSVVNALAARVESLVVLRQAATERFGEAGSTAMFGDMRAQLEQSQRMIDRAAEQVTNERAIVDPGGAGNPHDVVHLVKVDGQWKIAVSEMAAGLSEQELQERAQDAELFGRVSKEVAGEIKSGKHATPDDARRELETRLRTAVEQQTRARRNAEAQAQQDSSVQTAPEGSARP
jgi:hypothetical protein